MEPDSVGLVVVLVVLVGASFWLMARFARWVVRVVAGLLVVVLSAVTGMAVVNDYYGYYRSWSQLSADLSGSYAAFATTTPSRATVATGHGVVESVTLPGPRSRISRPGFVYLPPQYFEKRYATTRFPTVELIHGSPGTPSAWIVQLSIAKVMDELLAHHEIGLTIQGA